MKVEWKDAYKTGHEVIDQQHQRLFELTNALMEAHHVGDLRHAMVLLYKHTREHFDIEELLMRQCRYPDLRPHAEMHDNLLSRLNEISEEVGRGHVNRSALVQLMDDWALHHIPHEDAEFAVFMVQSAKQQSRA
jgi:hemerythrin